MESYSGVIVFDSWIDGINFIAGNKVTVSSKQDYVFAAGREVEIKDAEAKGQAGGE